MSCGLHGEEEEREVGEGSTGKVLGGAGVGGVAGE